MPPLRYSRVHRVKRDHPGLTVVINGGTATFSLPLPNTAGLIGLHLYLQGWAYAPGANAGDMIVSNGVEWLIGNT